MSNINYHINEIRKNWRNLRWWKSQIMERIIHPIELFFINGDYILNEDWRNLIILDACRYDIFKDEVKNYGLKGKLEYRTSRGANTGLFLRENFNKGFEGENLIYITANPWVNKAINNNKIKVVSVWKYGWDDELNTVLPETVYETTIKFYKYKNQNKRFIVHFLQPHGPYLKWQNGKYIKINSPEKWAYKENLKIVMPYIVKLCKIMKGRVIITADHGEAFGEKVWFLPIKIWGHPAIRIKSLIKVPWFITEGEGDLRFLERELVKLSIEKLKPKNRGEL